MGDTMTGTADLRFENITKKFGKVTAVSDVSFQIEHGKLVTLLGPSGCGKTTILRMIAGLEVPTSGKIYLGGEDITDMPPNERKITMVFQSYALFPHMNVYQNIAYGLKVRKWKKDRIQVAVKEALDVVGLKGLERRGASELSGGQQQRVALARALVLKPKVLLFDEPLSNLDAKLRNRMRGEIRNLQKDLGITSVYVTHDQSEALAIADQIVVMDNAVISQIGGPVELYTRPENYFVADFIGEANIVEAELIKVEGDLAFLKLGDIQLKAPFSTRPETGKPVKVMIRPEDILIQPEENRGLAGEIEFAMYQGAMNDYTVITEMGELRINDYETKGAVKVRGTRVSLSFREDSLFIIH